MAHKILVLYRANQSVNLINMISLRSKLFPKSRTNPNESTHERSESACMLILHESQRLKKKSVKLILNNVRFFLYEICCSIFFLNIMLSMHVNSELRLFFCKRVLSYSLIRHITNMTDVRCDKVVEVLLNCK